MANPFQSMKKAFQTIKTIASSKSENAPAVTEPSAQLPNLGNELDQLLAKFGDSAGELKDIRNAELWKTGLVHLRGEVPAIDNAPNVDFQQLYSALETLFRNNMIFLMTHLAKASEAKAALQTVRTALAIRSSENQDQIKLQTIEVSILSTQGLKMHFESSAKSCEEEKKKIGRQIAELKTQQLHASGAEEEALLMRLGQLAEQSREQSNRKEQAEKQIIVCVNSISQLESYRNNIRDKNLVIATEVIQKLLSEGNAMSIEAVTIYKKNMEEAREQLNQIEATNKMVEEEMERSNEVMAETVNAILAQIREFDIEESNTEHTMQMQRNKTTEMEEQ